MKYIDLDFFQPERDREAEKRKAKIPLIIGCIIIFLLIVIYIILRLQENSLNDELTELTSEVTTEQVNVTTLQQQIADVDSSIKIYEDVNGNGTSNPYGMKLNDIQAVHLRSIMASTPSEAFYKNITIKDNLLKLDGYTKSTQVVAKIVYNLESTSYFEEVIISNIAKDEDNGYSFTIDAFIKE